MDRSSYVKTLQYMCGIRTYFYWPTIFIFDFILYLIQLSVLVFIIWIYSEFFTVANIFGKSSELCKFTIFKSEPNFIMEISYYI